MAFVIFYEKPGCATNARQRHLIEAAGNQLIARDLFAVNWTESGLRRFFGNTPVKSWLNPAAPVVRSGLIDPETIHPETALAAMLADPLLIRRPLMVIDELCVAGFDFDRIARLLNLSARRSGERDPQLCVRAGVEHTCAPPLLDARLSA